MPTEPQASLLLSDGSLEFRILRKDGTETPVSIDLLVLKLCCEQCEEDHRLKTANGMTTPTPAFLHDLAGRLAENGVPDCTPSLAWQLWIASIEQMSRLKKTTNGTPKSLFGTESTPEPSPEPKSSDTSPT